MPSSNPVLSAVIHQPHPSTTGSGNPDTPLPIDPTFVFKGPLFHSSILLLSFSLFFFPLHTIQQLENSSSRASTSSSFSSQSLTAWAAPCQALLLLLWLQALMLAASLWHSTLLPLNKHPLTRELYCKYKPCVLLGNNKFPWINAEILACFSFLNCCKLCLKIPKEEGVS